MSWPSSLISTVLVAICQAIVVYAETSADSGDTSSTMSTGAIIGIIIACIAILLIIIAVVVVFFICRQRRLHNKTTTQTRQTVSEARTTHESGSVGLPVDIPVQALAREPPPRYTSIYNLSSSSISSHHQLPPPPYTTETSGRLGFSYDMSVDSYQDDSLTDGERSYCGTGPPPPGYQSSPRVELDVSRSSAASGIILHASSPRIAPRAGSASAGRLRSIDSFTEYPSMSDILLTSSRSSLPTSSESAAGMMAEADEIQRQNGVGSRRSDSAHGDSIDSWPSGDGQRHHSQFDNVPQRSTSLTDVAISRTGCRNLVPDSEIQRQAHRRTGTSTQNQNHRPHHRSQVVSMDPCPTPSDAVHRRRRTAVSNDGMETEQRRPRRKKSDGNDSRTNRRKSRSASHMMTVDEETTTATIQVHAPTSLGSVV